MATIWERLGLQKRARIGKFDSATIAQELGIYAMTRSGANVSEQSSLAISTVYACVYKIASTISSLGLDVYVRDGASVDVANAHPAHDLIKYEPNSRQTAYEFWETIVA